MPEEKQPRGFRKAKEKTNNILQNKERLNHLISAAGKKAQHQKSKLKSVWKDFQTLFNLLKAWRSGNYTDVPWKTILYSATAILYFLNPLDVIPDFIPLTGLIDDLSIITFVLRSLKDDLNKFKEWEEENQADNGQ
jgi:uncharacterized membrane protein YkvA (DUF1232 family)